MIFLAYGTNIGPSTLTLATLNAAGAVSNVQAAMRLLFDGTPAPIVYVSANQSSGIVPYNVAGKNTTQMVVEVNGTSSAPVTLQVADVAPAIFSVDFSGKGQGAILNADNSVNSAGNPAQAGSIVVVYGTGEGKTVPAGQDGVIAATVYPKPVLAVTAKIAGQPGDVVYYGAAPGQVAGLIQINVRVPANTPSGNQPIVFSVGPFESQANLTVAIR
jgi:uncharacterized protein (TIGR03437 family)